MSLVTSGCGKGQPAEAPARPPQEVGVVTLVPERVQIVTELPGRTAPFRVAEVRPQVGGIILKRFFQEGGEVREGEQLYQIDPARYQADYDGAKAYVARAEAAVEIARLLSDRQNALVAVNAVSKQEHDDAAAALKQAEADLSVAQAELEVARINLDYTRVLSPISGKIGRSFVTEGALVTPGQADLLARVFQLDPIYVDVTQSSVQLLRLRRELAAGQLKDVSDQEASAQLIIEDGTLYPEPGKLQFSEVNVDPGTGSVTLRAVFPNPQQALLPGMFVRALVKEGVNDQAILVPQKGVTRNAKGEPTALVLGSENQVELRVLKTDRVVGNRWLVSEGVKAGDRVILEGLQKIGPGAAVHPVELASETPKGK